MKEQDALQLGRALMEKHGLVGWALVVNRRLRVTEAQCCYGHKRIELSTESINLGDSPMGEPMDQVILHEIAHAIHWERIRDIDPLDLRPSEELGHGKMWKTICAEVGYLVPDYYEGDQCQ